MVTNGLKRGIVSIPGALLSGIECLEAEALALDAFVANLDGEAFEQVTPLEDFTVRDIVRHLVNIDRLALLSIADPSAFAPARDALNSAMSIPAAGEGTGDPTYVRLRVFEKTMVGTAERAELIAQWREGVSALSRAARALADDRQVEWFGPPMRVSRLLAARQMELFCYGQDIFDAFEKRRVCTDRIRPVADFGVRTRGFAFAANGSDLPPAPFVRLMAPSGREWTWGDPDAADRIFGSAEQFCQVVTQRRNVADTALEVIGEGAARWMAIAQTIAGHARPHPAPGVRAWENSGRPHEPALPHAATVSAMVRHLAALHGDLPQVVEPAGETSFAEIEQRSARIAAGLLARGAPKGARIGVMMPNGADWVAAALAVQRVGGVAVLISTFAKGRELAHLIRHSDMHILLMSARDFAHDLTDRVAFALPGLAASSGDCPLLLTEAPFLRAIHVWGDDVPRWAQSADALTALADQLPPDLLEAAEAEVVPADPAFIIYTSGSSAEPKAVVHSHGAFVRQAHRMSAYMTYHPGDRLITTMPLFWVGGLVTSMLSANYRGGALICPATPDPHDVVSAIETLGATHIALWPAQLAAVLGSDTDGTVLTRLRPTSAQQLGLFGQASADRTPNGLGMTETLGPHSLEYYGHPLPVGREHSFGRRVGTIERRVVDPETGAILPAGATGEIEVRGGHMMLGMHRREREDVFTPDGWYRTGDIGQIDAAGFLYFDGRGGELVKSSGANISPREVELALALLPEVQEAVVLGLPDAEAGERLVAAVVLKPGAELDEQTARNRLRTDLSSYKVPKRIFFMAHDDIPRTPSSKVQKHRLRDILIGRLK